MPRPSNRGGGGTGSGGRSGCAGGAGARSRGGAGGARSGAGSGSGGGALSEEQQRRRTLYDQAEDDTRRLMYAAGDVAKEQQLPETVEAVMAVTERFVRELAGRMARRNRTHTLGGSRVGVLKDADDVVFLLRRDRRLHDRAVYLLRARQRKRSMVGKNGVNISSLAALGIDDDEGGDDEDDDEDDEENEEEEDEDEEQGRGRGRGRGRGARGGRRDADPLSML